MKQIVKASVASQAVESRVGHQTTQQPRAPVLMSQIQGGKRPICFAKAGVDGGDEHLRDVLSPADLLQFTEYRPRFFLFSPEGQSATQSGEHESAVAGKHSGLSQCRYCVGMLSVLTIRQAEIFDRPQTA
jgi:hypothetical protein